MKHLKIAFSTCPNDTFIFYALVNNKIGENIFEFDYTLADIAELNNFAFKKEFDVIKVSFNAYGNLLDYYNLLDSGSALGKGCGPILISKNYFNLEKLENKLIGIPGKYTTANYLFDFACKLPVKKVFMKFDEIIPAILDKRLDAGVIIHESRFTYRNFGLNKIIDLGEFWERKTNYPIPLGGIIIKKDISLHLQKEFDKLLKLSIDYAQKNFKEVLPFIKKYAKELDNEIIKSHIDLYVNEYTYSLGANGRKALEFFYKSGFNREFSIVGQNDQGKLI